MKFVSFARALLIIGVMCVFLIAVCDAFEQVKETDKPASLRLKQKKAKLKKLLTKIDMELYKQSEADVRRLLDKLIEKYWKPGQALDMNYDTGGLAAIGAMWFRGYEMLGEKKYLQAGVSLVDAILQTQREDGMFPSHATLRRKGKSEAHGRAELQDEYNFVQFALICYAYKLTKDKKYLDAALKHAETLRSCQDPSENEVWQGPWPHTYHGNVKPKRGEGYRSGYMLNDYATYDGMRTMVMAYKLTSDEKYIDRLKLLPAYMLKSNVGLGNVRGWRGQTDAWNEFTWQRHFEGPLIDPRNFNRFTCPMLTYFSAVLGDEVYLNMVREGYKWLKSVEKPKGSAYQYGFDESDTGGWSYKYTYDGREAWTGLYRNIVRHDFHGRNKVVLDGVEKVLHVAEQGDVEALRNWYGTRPVKYTPKQYIDVQIEAARRATDEDLTVRLWSLKGDHLVISKFLKRVRQRPAKLPKLGSSDGWIWRWWRPTRRPVPYRGWAAWQYVWDVRVALGKIDADTAAWGGRGLESAGAPTWFFPIWDTVGDWSTKSVEARNWLDIPLEDTLVHVKDVSLKPDSMTLNPGETREIKPVFKPENATCKTGIWKVNSAGVHNVCWIEPEMKDEINPSVVKPEYSREGKIMVHAGMPHGAPKATITFTTTDGKHTATCKVKVKLK